MKSAQLTSRAMSMRVKTDLRREGIFFDGIRLAPLDVVGEDARIVGVIV